MGQTVARTLKWEPHSGGKWGARSITGTNYWARDSGLWRSDPDNSGPDENEAREAQKQEDAIVWDCLSEEAKKRCADLHS